MKLFQPRVFRAALLVVFFLGLYSLCLRGQSGTPRLSFEVASIKTEPPDDGGTHIHTRIVGARYIATGQSAKTLIEYSYFLTDAQISGGPAWIKSEKYDIDAKIDDAQSAKWESLSGEERETQVKQMLQPLLLDRFHLKLSHRTKELPVLALVLAANGPKFGPSENPKGKFGTDNSYGNNGQFTAVEGNAPISNLIALLSEQPELSDRIVVDETGLTGKYDFTLKWTQNAVGGPESDAQSSAASGASIWTALQEQLGLKLVSKKSRVDTIVIDGIEHPTPN